jgi:hypothetical protein
VTDLDDDDTYEPRLSTGPTRPTSRVLDLDDDSLDEASDRHEKHPSKRPLTQGTKTLAAAELPSKPSGPHSARVAASSQERVHPSYAGMKNQNLSQTSKYISPTANPMVLILTIGSRTVGHAPPEESFDHATIHHWSISAHKTIKGSKSAET